VEYKFKRIIWKRENKVIRTIIRLINNANTSKIEIVTRVT